MYFKYSPSVESGRREIYLFRFHASYKSQWITKLYTWYFLRCTWQFNKSLQLRVFILQFLMNDRAQFHSQQLKPSCYVFSNSQFFTPKNKKLRVNDVNVSNKLKKSATGHTERDFLIWHLQSLFASLENLNSCVE